MAAAAKNSIYHVVIRLLQVPHFCRQTIHPPLCLPVWMLWTTAPCTVRSPVHPTGPGPSRTVASSASCVVSVNMCFSTMFAVQCMYNCVCSSRCIYVYVKPFVREDVYITVCFLFMFCKLTVSCSRYN